MLSKRQLSKLRDDVARKEIARRNREDALAYNLPENVAARREQRMFLEEVVHTLLSAEHRARHS